MTVICSAQRPAATARRCCASSIPRGIRGIVSFGVAGGLDPTLNPATSSSRPKSWPGSHAGWPHRSERNLAPHRASTASASSRHPCRLRADRRSTQSKAALAARRPAPRRRHGKPYRRRLRDRARTAVRGAAGRRDPAARALPAVAVARSRRTARSTRGRSCAAWRAVPTRSPDLMRTARDFNRAMRGPTRLSRPSSWRCDGLVPANF